MGASYEVVRIVISLGFVFVSVSKEVLNLSVSENEKELNTKSSFTKDGNIYAFGTDCSIQFAK